MFSSFVNYRHGLLVMLVCVIAYLCVFISGLAAFLADFVAMTFIGVAVSLWPFICFGLASFLLDAGEKLGHRVMLTLGIIGLVWLFHQIGSMAMLRIV